MSNEGRDIEVGATVTQNIRVRTWDVETLRRIEPRWDDLSKQAKRWACTYASPETEDRASNVTVTDLHDYLVDNLDKDQSANKDASHLALGDDSTSPGTGNSSLNNRVNTVAITDSIDKGTELLTSTFLDSTQLNGTTIKEVGLKTASSGGTLLNHSTNFNSVSKTNNNTATFDVSLVFSDA